MLDSTQSRGNDLANALLAQVRPVTRPTVTGKWFPIRIKPNLATGELLNVGVGLTIGRKTHVKLLQTAEPFKQLYGKAGSDNFTLLLEMIDWHFAHQKPKSKTPSPHIVFGNPAAAAGDSVAEILNRLYQQMVSLRLIADKSKSNRANYNTDSIRTLVRKELNSINSDFVGSYWFNHPVYMPGDERISANLQVFIPNEMSREALFASIISVDYADKNMINSQFSTSFYDLATADSALKKGRGRLLIYRPENAPEDIADMTDNAIDRAYYNLKKHTPNTTLGTFNAPKDIANEVISLAT